MVVALVAWTVVVWLGRIRNIVTDDGVTLALAVPVLLVALALFALADRRRGVPVLAAATIAVWAVRLPFVLVHDHSAGFKVVHLALAVISVALAGLAVRGRRPVLSRPR